MRAPIRPARQLSKIAEVAVHITHVYISRETENMSRKYANLDKSGDAGNCWVTVSVVASSAGCSHWHKQHDPALLLKIAPT